MKGETGLLFRPGDVGQLAEAISFLAERPELSAKMGAACRELVRNQHSPEAHYLALTRLYEQLALRRRKPAEPEVVPDVKRPLRVAFIGGRGVISKYSGIEAYYEEIGKRLADMGHEVTVYCRTYFTPRVNKYNGMRLVRLPTIRSKQLETLVHTLLSTIQVMFSSCDIVHYHALGPALFSFFPRLLGEKDSSHGARSGRAPKKVGAICLDRARPGRVGVSPATERHYGCVANAAGLLPCPIWHGHHVRAEWHQPAGTLRGFTASPMGAGPRQLHPISWAVFAGKKLPNAD